MSLLGRVKALLINKIFEHAYGAVIYAIANRKLHTLYHYFLYHTYLSILTFIEKTRRVRR